MAATVHTILMDLHIRGSPLWVTQCMEDMAEDMARFTEAWEEGCTEGTQEDQA